MVRFSKTIQRAIPQKIRRSASMLKCETTPFCYTPKYATIVLRFSGALKHWLVSSVASLGGLARVGAPWRPASIPHVQHYLIHTTDTTTRKVVFIIYINTFASDVGHFICQIHAIIILIEPIAYCNNLFPNCNYYLHFRQKKQLRLNTTSQRPQTH